jgi:hypothetical protein
MKDYSRLLLQTGANIGIKNWWGELPISRIQPELLGKLSSVATHF